MFTGGRLWWYPLPSKKIFPMKKFTTNSANQTQKFAANLAQKFKGGGVILLSGDLGAGKTTFVQGFAKTLGITGNIISPTFILIKNYGKLFHIDLYRLQSVSLEGLGLSEIISDPTNIVLIEWPERLQSLPSKFTLINIHILSSTKRGIEITEH